MVTSTGRKMIGVDPQGTTPPASTTSARLPPSTDETELLTRWGEEKLKGIYEPCRHCDHDWLNTKALHTCHVCMDEGVVIREDYLDAERALTPDQRREIGVENLQEVYEDEVSILMTKRLAEQLCDDS